jgi:ribosomal-protein-alanine N-acetyltransferase
MDDIDRIMDVMSAAFDPVFGEAWSRAQVESALMMGHCHYLLIAGNGETGNGASPIAGFALLRSILDESELLLFAIKPEWRRKGLATKLLCNVLLMMQKNGINRTMLEMRTGNSAEKLYLKNGFKPIGMRPKYYRTAYGERLDAITFERILNADGIDSPN